MKISVEKFNSKLEKHQLWLNNEAGGVLAVFRAIDFSRFDFSGADLTRAVFIECKFDMAVFDKANLSMTQLTYSSFRGTTFRSANLVETKLNHSNFREVNLWFAIVHNVDMRGSTWSEPKDTPFAIYNFSLGKHLAVATPEYLAIGCMQYKWGVWLKGFRRIGRFYHYSEEEIERYGKVIKLYAEILGVIKGE